MPAAPAAPPAQPGPALGIHRFAHNHHADVKGVGIWADDVITWTENQGSTPYFVLLLRGKVLLEHGAMQVRFQEGVARIDLARYKNPGELYLQVYGEGSVRIQDSTLVEVPRVAFEITTRGHLKLHSYQNKLQQRQMDGDPVVVRARAEGVGPVARPAAPVQPVGYEQPRVVLPPTVVPQTPPLPAGPPPSGGLVPPRPVAPMNPPAPAPFGRPLSWLPGSDGAVQLAERPEEPHMVFRAAAPDSRAPAIPVQLGGGPPGVPPPDPTVQPGAAPAPPAGGVPLSPGAPPGPAGSEPIPGPGPVVPAPSGPTPLPPVSKPRRPPPGAPLMLPTRNYTVAPRSSSARFNAKIEKLGDEQAIIITGGIILYVRNAPRVGFIDMEADRLVIWTRDLDAEQVLGGMQKREGHTSNKLEFYLSGNVIIRQSPSNNPKGQERTIRANEVYYDVNRSVAIITQGQVQVKQFGMQEPVFFQSEEIHQLNETTFEFKKGEAFSSKLPSDPGLQVFITDATVEDKVIPLKNIFGQPQYDRKTGKPLTVEKTIMTSRNLLFELEHVPFFYLPYSRIDLREPLGPVQNFNFGYNQIFGLQLGVSLNFYELLGIQPFEGTRWLLNLDYLSLRGPALGTTFDYKGVEPFGVPGRYSGIVKLFGMHDMGSDNLGGPRPFNTFDPPGWRGRGLWQHVSDQLPYGFSTVDQVDGESDRNFLEQYFKREFDLNPDRITEGEIQQQQENWAWSLLVQPRTRAWATETQWLPRGDGWLVGQNFFGWLTYSSHGSLAYADLLLTSDANIPNGLGTPNVLVDPITDQSTPTGRADWMQDLSLPLQLGAFKLVPYGVADLTAYSRDLQGNAIGRVWGGGGARASLPLSALYPKISSQLLNLNGINHKIVFTADYLYARTNVSHYQLPQLDRLNDLATQQAARDMLNADPILYPTKPFLVNNPIFDPQLYAIRQMILWRTDTLDNINVLSASMRQRWQTKRGYPGSQHIVDWMTLELSGFYFPDPNNQFGLPYLRDHFPQFYFTNFGAPNNAPNFSQLQFLQYDWVWNVGDRTALTSTGWIDPYTNGPRVFTLGGYFNRNDRTNFYLGYRQIDPLNSRVATLSVTYVFSPKYAITGNTMYDFGTKQSLGNSLLFTRMGTDLQVSLGFNYNAMQNNFGFLFNVIPNLLPANRAMGPIGAGGTSAQQSLQ
jgi:hypothetical protein